MAIWQWAHLPCGGNMPLWRSHICGKPCGRQSFERPSHLHRGRLCSTMRPETWLLRCLPCAAVGCSACGFASPWKEQIPTRPGLWLALGFRGAPAACLQPGALCARGLQEGLQQAQCGVDDPAAAEEGGQTVWQPAASYATLVQDILSLRETTSTGSMRRSSTPGLEPKLLR